MAAKNTRQGLHSLQSTHIRQTHTLPPQKELLLTDLAICASPADHRISPAKRRRLQQEQQQLQMRDPESLGALLRRGLVEHQLGLSVNLMLLVVLAYIFFPTLRERMSAFFWLSYPTTETATAARVMYSQGPRDLYMVASFIVFFTAVRAFCLDYVLMPLAGACGLATKNRVRFAEQSYMILYYGLYWSWGLWLFIRDTPSDVHDISSLLISLWTGFPKLTLDAGMKLYYLSQLAFWIQQIVVIHIEEQRKDHLQMLTHHITTVTLLCGSYPYRQWRVGNAVLICMDLVDVILPLAKVLRYLSFQVACDAAFAVFVILWLIQRHIAYLAICWSIYAHVNSAAMPYGRYSTRTGARISEDGGTNMLDNLLQPILHHDSETVSFNANIRWMFLGLLLFLQCIIIGWFIMICRVVMRVVRGEGADDTRSDDEGEDEDVDAELGADDLPTKQAPDFIRAHSPAGKEGPRFIEVEATSEDVTYASSQRSSGSSSKRKAKGISSGLNLNGHKEILNRIGCLSEEQLAREREKSLESSARKASGRSGGAAGKK